MFMPGTGTTAAVIEWTMSALMKYPKAMEKTQCELRICLDNIKNSEESAEHGLHYLRLVIKETLRLYPPVPLLPRKSTEACEIKGYTIPINTSVFVNVSGMGRDPDLWEDAEKFIPERFNGNMFEFNGNDFEYLPFGTGRRIFPGMSFALATIELVLSQLLYHFNWKLPTQIKPEELDMIETTGIHSKRQNPLCLITDFKEATLF